MTDLSADVGDPITDAHTQPLLPSQPALGALLRAYRSEQHLTVNAFAVRSGVARSQLCAMLAGTASPGATVSDRLAGLLKANPPSAAAVAEHDQPATRRAAPDTALRTLVLAAARQSGLSITEVAERAGVGRTALFSWLAGTTVPAPRHQVALAGTLGVDVASLADAAGSRVRTAQGPTEKLRAAATWTQAELAARAEVSVTAVRRLERGETVRPSTITAVAAALGVSAAALTDGVSSGQPVDVSLSGRIAALLSQRAWTSSDLAAHLGVHRQQLSAWRAGVDPVPAQHVPALAALFGISAGELAIELHEQWSARPMLAVAQRRAAARAQAGLRQRDVAAAAGVAHTTYTRWEGGRGYLHERHLNRVADVLGVPVDTLR